MSSLMGTVEQVIGKITTNFESEGNDRRDYAYGVTLDQDGKIVVAGDSSFEFAVARYNASDGTLDTSFNADGKVVTKVGV